MKYKFLLFIILAVFSGCKKEDTGNVSIYFPAAGSDQWETTSISDAGWKTDSLQSLLNLLDNNGTRAFLLLKNGRIVVEHYNGNNIYGTGAFDKNAAWYWASSGKTLTSFTVGKAIEENYLTINDKSSDYLGTGWSSLTSLQESKITVWHQLTMTTGLDDGVTDNHSTLKADLIYKADPGTRWAYHNAPYTLLEKVVATATGKDFNTYFATVLQSKIGMDGTWIWSDYDHVYYSTPRSMARYGILMLNQGIWNNVTIMSSKSFYNAMITTSQNLNKSYGCLWWLNGKESYMVPDSQVVIPGSMCPNGPSDMFSAMGKNGQFLSVVPSLGLVMVRMGDNPSSVQVPFQLLDEIWKKLKYIVK